MRIGWRVVVTVGAAAAVAAGTIGAAFISDSVGRDDGFVIESFDREVVVDELGAAEVTETIDVRFTESRRGIFRDLPFDGPAGSVSYTFRSVDQGDASQPWRVNLEPEPGLLRVRIGDANVWLEPGQYRYRLQYRMDGLPFEWAEAPGGGPPVAEVRIDVPGDRWPTEVQATTLRVRGPADVLDAACVQGRTGAITACDEVPTLSGNEAAVEVAHLDRGETATVAVQFPAGTFGPLPPPLEGLEPLGTSPDNWLSALHLDLPLAAVLLASLFALPFVLIQISRALVIYRDQVTDPALHNREHPAAIPAPPDGLRPPELAGLLLRGDQNALFLSSLVDMDQRGAIASTQVESGKDTSLIVVGGSPEAVPSQQDADFLGALQVGIVPLTFDGKYNATTSARVSAASRTLQQRARQVFETNGLLHHRGAVLMSGWFRTLQALVVLSFVVFVGWQFARYTPLPVGAVFGIAGIVLVGLIIAQLPWRHHRLPLNSEGRDTVARARAFREYVATVESEQLEWAAGQPGIDHLHPAVSLLPYAIVLGLADSWYSRFGDVMAELAARAPGAAAAGGVAWWAHQRTFNDASSAQRSSTTAPSSSSGGGGGGGSGSGGGGGGGGSW